MTGSFLNRSALIYMHTVFIICTDLVQGVKRQAGVMTEAEAVASAVAAAKQPHAFEEELLKREALSRAPPSFFTCLLRKDCDFFCAWLCCLGGAFQLSVHHLKASGLAACDVSPTMSLTSDSSGDKQAATHHVQAEKVLLWLCFLRCSVLLQSAVEVYAIRLSLQSEDVS